MKSKKRIHRRRIILTDRELYAAFICVSNFTQTGLDKKESKRFASAQTRVAVKLGLERRYRRRQT